MIYLQQAFGTLCSLQEIPDAQALPTDAITIEPPVSDTSRIDGLNLTSPSDTHSSTSSTATVIPEVFSFGIQVPPFAALPNHQTSLPIIQSRMREFSEEFFLSIESQQIKTLEAWKYPETRLSHIQKDVTDELVESFLSDVCLCHPYHPIIDRDTFLPMYENFMSNRLIFNIQAAICLVVFALGASEIASVDSRDQYWGPGLKYFQPALTILTSETTRSCRLDSLLSQAVALAGIYLDCLAKPLHRWKLIYTAPNGVQLLLLRLVVELFIFRVMFRASEG